MAVGQTISTLSNAVDGNLPKEAIRSHYRIQLMESGADELDSMGKSAGDYTAKYRQNCYIVRNGDVIQLHAGDYAEKSFARQKLSWLKKTYPGIRIVKTRNDSIIAFSVFVKRKPVKPTPPEISAVVPVISSEIAAANLQAGFPVWNRPEYVIANSAQNEDYLTQEEKMVYYYLNLVRLNPALFAKTYLGDLRHSKGYYEESLWMELQTLKPLPVLKPNRKLFESAQCHATQSGMTGYIGHDRTKCAAYFAGECCHYGPSDPMEVVRGLLIDHDVSSLGHRKTCLNPRYTELGVSIQPHKSYIRNAVLDFR
ncbi:MAG: CAP domain-containing protein [Bacteroidetes bacterium]|nr:CAP domain-containing protein [Bacteroidota bacterium]